MERWVGKGITNRIRCGIGIECFLRRERRSRGVSAVANAFFLLGGLIRDLGLEQRIKQATVSRCESSAIRSRPTHFPKNPSWTSDPSNNPEQRFLGLTMSPPTHDDSCFISIRLSNNNKKQKIKSMYPGKPRRLQQLRHAFWVSPPTILDEKDGNILIHYSPLLAHVNTDPTAPASKSLMMLCTLA